MGATEPAEPWPAEPLPAEPPPSEPLPAEAMPAEPLPADVLDPDSVEVLRGELALLRRAVRAHPDAVLALLHADFTEVGASGRVWDRAGVAEALAAEPPDPAAGDELVVRVADLTCTRLSPGVVRVTYTAHAADRITRRSSVWVREGDGPWLMRSHRGTVVPPQPPDDASAGPPDDDSPPEQAADHDGPAPEQPTDPDGPVSPSSSGRPGTPG